jgi:hypothetical protein
MDFDLIVKDRVEYIVDGGSKLVASDGMDKAVASPRFAGGGILCPELLTLMGSGAGRYNGIQRRFGSWYVEWCSITCKVKGWVLEESQVALVVARDSHKVGGEFTEDQF